MKWGPFYWMTVTSRNRCDMSCSSVRELHHRLYRSVDPFGVLRIEHEVHPLLNSCCFVCLRCAPTELGSNNSVWMTQCRFQLKLHPLQFHDIVSI